MRVSAGTFECSILDGNCSIVSYVYMNQTYIGATYTNTSVNVTINGSTSSDVGLCNFSCMLNKTHGNTTNKSNGEIVNISWCNPTATIISGSVREIFLLNASEFVTNDTGLCNASYSVWLNGSQDIVIEIKASEARKGTTDYPLIPIGAASLVVSAILIRLWYKHKRT